MGRSCFGPASEYAGSPNTPEIRNIPLNHIKDPSRIYGVLLNS